MCWRGATALKLIKVAMTQILETVTQFSVMAIKLLCKAVIQGQVQLGIKMARHTAIPPFITAIHQMAIIGTRHNTSWVVVGGYIPAQIQAVSLSAALVIRMGIVIEKGGR